MLNSILLISFLLCIPVLSNFLCKKWKFFRFLGPVVVCYLFGIIAVNAGVPFVDAKLNQQIMEAAVPLAIILLLLSSDFSVWKRVAGAAGLSYFFVLLSVTASACAGYFLFNERLSEAAVMAGMLTGVYTGGTPNMAAVGTAVNASPELFGLLNMYDVVWGGLYLLFIMTMARPLYQLILPVKMVKTAESDLLKDPSEQQVSISGILVSILISVFILGAGIGLSMAIFGSMNGGFIIAFITVLAVLASFIPRVKNLKGSFAAGDFFLLVFGTSMGLMSDFSHFKSEGLEIGVYMGFVLLLSMALHLFLSALFKIDRDTVIITSAAGVMSPPFVPAIARSIKNPQVIVPGMAAGILGNAVGNILGIAVTRLLDGSLDSWFQ